MESDNDEQSAYPYQELQWRNGNDVQIRILIVEPSVDAAAPVSCRLVARYIQDDPIYETLSYMWCEPGDLVEITIQGHEVLIRRNLHDALKVLRLQDNPRRLWADAICINQDDHQEKSEIVRNMHVFYSRAVRTVIWLGQATEDSALAMDVLETVGKDLQSAHSKAELAALRLVMKNRPSPTVQAHWVALSNLFGRAYWSRAWIVQEIAYSNDFVVVCAEKELNFRWVFQACDSLYKVSPATGEAISIETQIQLRGMITVVLASSFWLRIHSQTKDGFRLPLRSLGYVLSILRPFRSTDPRDKVYGCMSLASQPVGFGRSQVDYSERCGKLYARVARRLIEQDSTLSLLSSCDTFGHDSEVNGLRDDVTSVDGYQRGYIPDIPTWAPNWANPRTSAPFWGNYEQSPHDLELMGLDQTKQPYCAAGNTNAEFLFSDGSMSLTVRGIVLDTVVYRSTYPYACSIHTVYEEAVELCTRSANASARYLPDLSQAVRLTLTGNRDNLGLQLSADKLAILLADSADGSFTNDAVRMLTSFLPRPFFITGSGYMGLGPLATEINDTICLIKGCFVPMILRRIRVVDGGEKINSSGNITHEEASFYRVIGPAYVHGVMEGEGATQLESDKAVEFILR